MSEPVQTNVSSPDVATGNAISPAPASSSGQSSPGEAPVQERLKRVDTDEEMRTGESDSKKPRVAAIGAITVCVTWLYVKMCTIRVLIRHGIRFPGDPHVAMKNVMNMDIVACRRCLSHIGHLTAESADQEEEIMDVSGELHEHEPWEPEKYITISTSESRWTKICT